MPSKLKENLLPIKKTYASLVLKLFDYKKTLNVNEVMVGLYRDHNIEARREKVQSILAYLASQKHLMKVSKGLYELNYSASE